MELGLKRKRVFVTASSNGIGKAIAEDFLKEGAIVIVNGRDRLRLDHTLENFRESYGSDKIYGIQGDMSDPGQIEAAFQELRKNFKNIDIVVGNLGMGKPISKDKFDMEEWTKMFQVNLFSSVGLVGRFRELFPKQGGSIVLLASLAAHDRIGAPPAYAAAKAGLVSFIKYSAPILIKEGIRINGVSPGNIIFEGGRWEDLLMQDKKGTEVYINSTVPMKRFGKTEEISAAVIFLASEKSSFTTGVVLQADGGQSVGY